MGFTRTVPYLPFVERIVLLSKRVSWSLETAVMLHSIGPDFFNSSVCIPNCAFPVESDRIPAVIGNRTIRHRPRIITTALPAA